MLVSLLTPTGDRPFAFDLCERWMQRQDYQGEVEWVVVDDGPTPTPTTGDQLVHRPIPFWQQGQNTQRRNLLAGLEICSGEVILIIEDDDWYAPAYVRTMVDLSRQAPLFGICCNCYYNVSFLTYTQFTNNRHASLCGTGFCRSELPIVREAIERAAGDHVHIDMKIWGMSKDSVLIADAASTPLVVGIKGMPGRAGTADGHGIASYYKPDPDMVQLREWIGDDVKAYSLFLGRGREMVKTVLGLREK